MDWLSRLFCSNTGKDLPSPPSSDPTAVLSTTSKTWYVFSSFRFFLGNITNLKLHRFTLSLIFFKYFLIYFEHRQKKYEGPKTWTEEHSRLVVESTKKPLFPSIEEASIATGIPEEVLEFESGRYIHLAYVNIRVK